jgi:hypothetical protein
MDFRKLDFPSSSPGRKHCRTQILGIGKSDVSSFIRQRDAIFLLPFQPVPSVKAQPAGQPGA